MLNAFNASTFGTNRLGGSGWLQDITAAAPTYAGTVATYLRASPRQTIPAPKPIPVVLHPVTHPTTLLTSHTTIVPLRQK